MIDEEEKAPVEWLMRQEGDTLMPASWPWYLIRACQEQQAQITMQQALIEDLQKQINDIREPLK